MLRELPTYELIRVLETRKELIKKCRTKNEKISKVDLKQIFIKNELITDKENTDIPSKEDAIILVSERVKAMSSEDNFTSTKTYMQKFKGGYFGKRKSRF